MELLRRFDPHQELSSEPPIEMHNGIWSFLDHQQILNKETSVYLWKEDKGKFQDFRNVTVFGLVKLIFLACNVM